MNWTKNRSTHIHVLRTNTGPELYIACFHPCLIKQLFYQLQLSQIFYSICETWRRGQILFSPNWSRSICCNTRQFWVFLRHEFVKYFILHTHTFPWNQYCSRTIYRCSTTVLCFQFRYICLFIGPMSCVKTASIPASPLGNKYQSSGAKTVHLIDSKLHHWHT